MPLKRIKRHEAEGNSPKKVALLIHALYGGGAERLMSELASRWAEHHAVSLVTWAKTETDAYPLPSSVRRHGLDLMHQSGNVVTGLFANLNRVRRLRETLRQIQPDVVVSFADQMNIVALQAARPLDMPVWISEHSDPSKQKLSRLWETWRASVYPTCEGCVVLTRDIAQKMERWIPAGHIRVIPPAIEAAEVETSAGSSDTSVLFVGRLSPEKRVDLLIEAWRGIQEQIPQWKLQIVGDGEQRQELEELARGIDSIQFLGWQQQPKPFYQRAQIFALPSNYEGFPVALLEAMHAGLACVTTRCTSAIDELMQDDESAAAHASLATIAVGDRDALAERLVQLAHDSELRSQMGQAARAVSERYLWPQVGVLWDSLLEQ